MAIPTDAERLAQHLLVGATPEEGPALLDSLISGRVSSIFEKMQAAQPTLQSAPTEVRGFRVRLDLHGAKPPVWRRFELPGDLTLPRLHDVIQAVMGWTDSHLHRFRTGSDHRSPYFVTIFDLGEVEDALSFAVAEPVAVTGELGELFEVLGRPTHTDEVTDAEAARLTQTYQVFLDVIGDGLRLTGAGYLPPAIVERFTQRSGITSCGSARPTART